MRRVLPRADEAYDDRMWGVGLELDKGFPVGVQGYCLLTNLEARGFAASVTEPPGEPGGEPEESMRLTLQQFAYIQPEPGLADVEPAGISGVDAYFSREATASTVARDVAVVIEYEPTAVSVSGPRDHVGPPGPP
jgi:hypothetical protein